MITGDEASTSGVAAASPRNAAPLPMEILQKAILNRADFAIIATDADGIIRVFNAGAERLLGYAASDVVDTMASTQFHDPQQLIARAQQLSAEFVTTITPGFNSLTFKASRGIADQYDLDYVRKDGSRFRGHVAITVLRDEQDGIIGYLNVCTDDSVRLAMIAADKEKHRLKDEFVATVSHELRTPLTSITGALGLLIGNTAGQLPKSAVHLLTVAYANSQRLVRLLNDILDIEKMESGKAVFDLKRVEVRSLLERTIEDNRGYAEDCGVRLRLTRQRPRSTCARTPTASCRLSPISSRTPSSFRARDEEVIVAVKPRGDTVHISVRDHGPGVPQDFKPRIFEKFAQADGTNTRKKGGTGLGLSIVKQIVDRLDGTVGFADAPGGGAIFYIDLPNWARAVKLQSRVVRKAHLRILLCEDDPEAAIVLVDRLGQEGFLADVALSANDAVARVAATPYSAILVDLQRPEGDGIDLIRQLRAQPQAYNTLLVMLSADLGPDAENAQPATMLNIVDWLDRPIDVSRLVRVLDRPIARNGNTRPRILHVESDPEILHVVASALGAKAEIMSVDSIDEARRALAVHHFDVAILDVAVAAGSGFELLHELRDGEGDAIPLVVFSPLDLNPGFAEQLRSALIKSRTSIDDLIVILQKRLAGSFPPSNDKDAA